MSLNANDIKFEGGSNGRPKENTDPGTYPTRLAVVATLGVQDQGEFEGKPKPAKLELMLTWECLDEFLKDSEGKEDLTKPKWFSERMPFNPMRSEKAKSTIRYKTLDPNDEKKGDWAQLLGTPAMMTLAQTKGKKDPTRIFEKVTQISAMREREAKKAPDLINEPYVFDFYAPTQEAWDRLPEWIQKRAMGALDFEGSALERFLSGSTGVVPPVKDFAVEDAPEEEEDGQGEEW